MFLHRNTSLYSSLVGSKLNCLINLVQNTSSYPAVKQFTCLPTLSRRDLLTFINPYNEKKLKPILCSLFTKYGSIFKLRIPGSRYDQVFISHPEDVRCLLQSDGSMPITAGFDFFVAYRRRMMKDQNLKSGGLVGAHGVQWYQVRSLVQQDMMRPKSAMFYIDSIENISEQLNDVIETLVDAKSREVDDITEACYRWALESITSIFLNSRLGCLDKTPSEDGVALIQCSKVILGSDMYKLATRPPIWKYFPVPYYTRFDNAARKVTEICSKYVMKAKEGISMETKKTEDMSVLEKLIKASEDNDDIPVVMAVDAMIAGIDTTGNAATFLLYHLAANKQQQEALFKEIQEVIGNNPVTEAKLKKMKYLRACCQESHRLLPVASGIGRRTQRVITLSGYEIPRNTTVVYISLISNADPQLFTNQTKFIPARWLRGSPDHHHAHSYANVTFGHGPRMCVGRRFAELELFLLAIKVLQRFRLEYHHQALDLATSFTNKPDRKVKIRFVKR